MKYLPILLLPLLMNCHFAANNKTADGKAPDPNTIIFENLPQGDSLMVSFAVENTSQKDINIVRINTPCSCTQIAYDSGTISPGRTGQIAVKYKSDNDTGFISKAFVVQTSDTVAPLHTFYLRGNVVKK